MKAISLWQPWASAIALGLKRVETRSWPTKHRGPIAIHAARTKEGVRKGASEAVVRAFVHELGMRSADFYDRRELEALLPFGAIVAVAELVECQEATAEVIAAERRRRPLEVAMGDWWPGRWLWRLDSIEPIDPPVPALGRQGLFEVEDPRTAR